MAEMDPNVLYADIPGRPGYKVGTDGSVWSCWAWTPIHEAGHSGSRGCVSFLGTTWRNLAGTADRDGYLSLRFADKRRKIHHLVLEAFVGPCPPRMECCHNDGDTGNNRLENLRWDTKKSNNSDKVRHGTAQRGERHSQAKLSELEVLSARAEHAEGATYAALGRKYGINPSSIARVVGRRTWKHV